MRRAILAIWCLFPLIIPARADDLAIVARACGDPIETSAGVSSSGNLYRSVKYKNPTGEITRIFFRADSGNGPWSYLRDDDLEGKLPCLAASGIRPAKVSLENSMGDMIQPWHIIGALLLLTLYFAPYIVAMRRNCKAKNGIAVVNLFLGWTFIGWVVALAWAACGEPKLALPTAPVSG